MHDTRADFTTTFARLSTSWLSTSAPTTAAPEADAALPADADRSSDAAFQAWHAQWRARLARQAQAPEAVTALMQQRNPAVIPRNHVVEAALTAATDAGDLGPLERLMAALAAPYDYARDRAELALAPAPGGRPYRTFCGT